MNDKLLHALAGAAIASFCLMIASTPVAFVAVVAAAVGKEIIDSARGGTPDVLDAVATIAAGIGTIGIWTWTSDLLAA